MLNESTVTKLLEMRLGTMSQVFHDQMQGSDFAEMSFEERFGLLVDAEWAARKSNRLTRLIKKADFAISDACMENIDYHADRKLDKTLIARLVTCTYIQEAHNVLILGATGVGKTYLGCALGITACRSFYPVKYIRLPDLLSDLAIARSDGSYRKLIRQYQQIKLLILDEWLLFPLNETEARDLLEIVDARHRNASTVFCSQFDVDGWFDKIGESTIADAICDRIIHDAYRIVLQGESMRKKNGVHV